MHSPWVSPLFLLAVWLLQGGVVASDPVDVAHGAGELAPRQPRGAIDRQGRIHLTFGVGQSIVYRRSSDGGQTFSPPAKLPAAGVISLGMRRGPRIAATDAGVCVAWVAGEQGKGRDGDVVVCRSTDGGATWSQPTKVNDVLGSAREGLHDLAAGPRGELCCVWLDLRNRRTEIMAAVSADGGATWARNTLVYRSPDGSVCECCHPNVAFAADGAVHVMWRNSLRGERDMYLAVSKDAGRTFSAGTMLGVGHWKLDACPMDGGAFAIAADGARLSVWRREKSLYTTGGKSSREEFLATGEQPTLATTREGTYLAWLARRGGDLLLKGPTDRDPRVIARQAADPVAFSGDENGPVCLAWEANDGDRKTLRLQVLAKARDRSAPRGE